MDAYNVVIIEANSKLGIEFIRQLVSLPNPPEYIFATYTKEETIEDLINIEESSKKSQVIIIKMDCQLSEDIDKAKVTIQQRIGDRGLDFLINIISFTYNERNRTSSEILERQFQEYTLTPLLLFQTMLPLLEARALRNTKSNQESKSVFLNIIEDNSVGSCPLFEINKVALNLSMNVMADKVQKNHVLALSACVNTEEKALNTDEPAIENSVTSILFHIFCSAHERKSEFY